jgi:hypothetical protein
MTQGGIINKLLVGAGIAVASFFAPIKGLLAICFATTVVDMIFGIRLARK